MPLLQTQEDGLLFNPPPLLCVAVKKRLLLEPPPPVELSQLLRFKWSPPLHILLMVLSSSRVGIAQSTAPLAVTCLLYVHFVRVLPLLQWFCKLSTNMCTCTRLFELCVFAAFCLFTHPLNAAQALVWSCVADHLKSKFRSCVSSSGFVLIKS